MPEKNVRQKLKLEFTERIGIVSDLSKIIVEQNLTICAMEVERISDKALVYMEVMRIDSGDSGSIPPGIFYEVPGVINVTPIDALPIEEREQRFRVVLDNVSDGVLSVDAYGQVTTINETAQNFFGVSEGEVLGKGVEDVSILDDALIASLQGKTSLNVKRDVSRPEGRLQYFATCKPIKDSSGRIIGAVEIAKDMQEIKKLAKAMDDPASIGFSDIIGEDVAISQAISFAEQFAPTDFIVSVRGDSGTGKELFARAIHSASKREGPFLPINCAALPEQLLESELFGYAPGAFTGGKREGKPGLFEAAKGGTVFLDEIGDMPLPSQAKILRVIQEHRVRRIGGSKEVPIDVRIVTATNCNLERMVDDGKFRRDLYFRINVLPIHIPPLKERPEDIPLLTEHFLFQLSSRLSKRLKSFAPEAMAKLVRHDWSGNVRELRNVVERAAILARDEVIGQECVLFHYEIKDRMKVGPSASTPMVGIGNGSLKGMVADYERQIIREALRRSPSMRRAAGLLDISHTTLLNKMRKLGLDVE